MACSRLHPHPGMCITCTSGRRRRGGRGWASRQSTARTAAIGSRRTGTMGLVTTSAWALPARPGTRARLAPPNFLPAHPPTHLPATPFEPEPAVCLVCLSVSVLQPSAVPS